MNVLLWRTWEPLYEFPATFSALESRSFGGTCSQMLWHARNLVQLGAKVQVLGATASNCIEGGVQFVGAGNATDQIAAITDGTVHTPDVVFLEGSQEAASLFRERYPSATLIHVGQNIDRLGARKALANAALVDYFAFVNPGQMAQWCIARPDLIGKFILIRNVAPWEFVYSRARTGQVRPESVLWVGGWTKLGLRSWSRTMERVMQDNPRVRWKLIGPKYGKHENSALPAHVLGGLDFRADSIQAESLPLPRVFEEITKAHVVIVSLGDETACISALDAHAAGRPVISGNDIVFKFANPEATGIRVFSAEQRLEALTTLLGNLDLANEMGKRGQRFVSENYFEVHQRQDLRDALELVALRNRFGVLPAHPSSSRLGQMALRAGERLQRKLHRISSR